MLHVTGAPIARRRRSAPAAPAAAADAAPAEQALRPRPALGCRATRCRVAPPASRRCPGTTLRLLADRAVVALLRYWLALARRAWRTDPIRAASRGATARAHARRRSSRARRRDRRGAHRRAARPGSARRARRSASISPRRRPSSCAASRPALGRRVGGQRARPLRPRPRPAGRLVRAALALCTRRAGRASTRCAAAAVRQPAAKAGDRPACCWSPARWPRARPSPSTPRRRRSHGAARRSVARGGRRPTGSRATTSVSPRRSRRRRRALGETVAALRAGAARAGRALERAAFAAAAPEADARAGTAAARDGWRRCAAPATWQRPAAHRRRGARIGAGIAIAAAPDGARARRRRAADRDRRRRRGVGRARASSPIAASRWSRARPCCIRAHRCRAGARSAGAGGRDVVVVERDFLGWVKVDARRGEIGWVRRRDLVPLYGAGEAPRGSPARQAGRRAGARVSHDDDRRPCLGKRGRARTRVSSPGSPIRGGDPNKEGEGGTLVRHFPDVRGAGRPAPRTSSDRRRASCRRSRPVVKSARARPDLHLPPVPARDLRLPRAPERRGWSCPPRSPCASSATCATRSRQLERLHEFERVHLVVSQQRHPPRRGPEPRSGGPRRYGRSRSTG